MRGNGQAEAAETRFAVANGHRIAYRSVGDEGPHGVPIVFLNRFRGSMDDWDPALINAVARDRRVIFFDNVGVGESDGQTPGCLERAADDAVGFIRALGLDAVRSEEHTSELQSLMRLSYAVLCLTKNIS